MRFPYKINVLPRQELSRSDQHIHRKATLSIASPIAIRESINMISRSSLLGAPQEIRDNVYAHIFRDIQEERSAFEGKPVSKYDGLRLACRQLHLETSKSVFIFGFTAQQHARILEIQGNKEIFLKVRSISLEVRLGETPNYYQRLAGFLERMQLSLQELHIFFIGNDRQGKATGIHACGRGLLLSTGRGLPPLLSKGQDFDHQWEFIRSITLLRNLRVLQIDNANIPLSHAILYSNKPFLQAVSVTSDPRSTPSSISQLGGLKIRHLYRNISLKVHKFPPVKVLSLDANSISNIEGVVNAVNRSLRHFSWRVPNPDLQPSQGERCFSTVTNRLIQTLATGAPNLETLRLCITMRTAQQGKTTACWDTGAITEELSYRLPQFESLKHLEVHFTGGRGFFRDQLIDRLPSNLSRLYLSDDTISASELVTQIRKKYFTCLEDRENDFGRPLSPDQSRDESYGRPRSRRARANRQNSSVNYLSGYGMLGEGRSRCNDIPLGGGKLGFVTYEYSCPETEGDVNLAGMNGVYKESDRIQILRLNGKLLDREQHLHLAYTQEPGAGYGIKPKQQEAKQYLAKEELQETATFSHHGSIHAAIYDAEENAPKRQIVERNRQDLTECLGSHWYFGSEEDAMKIFEQEPVAPQRQKPTIEDVGVDACKRCRWAAPDFDIPPVGSLPLPAVPADWRDYI